MTDLLTLIDKLEKAEADYFDLDRDVGLATGQWRYLPEDYELNQKFPGARFMQAAGQIFNDNPGSIGGPSYTGDLDETIALVELLLPGWSIELISSHNPKDWVSFVAPPLRSDPNHKISDAWRANIDKLRATRAKTAPLSLCSALLKALHAKEQAR